MLLSSHPEITHPKLTTRGIPTAPTHRRKARKSSELRRAIRRRLMAVGGVVKGRMGSGGVCMIWLLAPWVGRPPSDRGNCDIAGWCAGQS
jgi:hypothetical protein